MCCFLCYLMELTLPRPASPIWIPWFTWSWEKHMRTSCLLCMSTLLHLFCVFSVHSVKLASCAAFYIVRYIIANLKLKWIVTKCLKIWKFGTSAEYTTHRRAKLLDMTSTLIYRRKGQGSLVMWLYSECLRRESNFLAPTRPVTALRVCACCLYAYVTA